MPLFTSLHEPGIGLRPRAQLHGTGSTETVTEEGNTVSRLETSGIITKEGD